MRSAAMAFLLACTAPAQTVSSPPGYLTVEGDLATSRFGAWDAARFLYLDGNFRGRVVPIKEVALRADYRDHPGAAYGSRRWTRVSLRVAQAQRAASVVFTRSIVTTPTLVFSGALTWSTLKGYPKSRPARWSHLFPFRGRWIYSARNDIGLDFDFEGGTLPNARAWSRAGLPYWLDGTRSATVGSSPLTMHGARGFGRGCRDDGQRSRIGAYTILWGGAYNALHRDPQLRGKHVVTSHGFYGPSGTNVVHATGLSGSATGVLFPGVLCNVLHVDVTRPTVYTLARTTTSVVPWSFVQFAFPYRAAHAGQAIWTQVAWSDTGTGAVKLSAAARTSLAVMPTAVHRALLVQTDPVFKSFSGFWTIADEWFPVMRYAR